MPSPILLAIAACAATPFLSPAEVAHLRDVVIPSLTDPKSCIQLVTQISNGIEKVGSKQASCQGEYLRSYYKTEAALCKAQGGTKDACYDKDALDEDLSRAKQERKVQVGYAHEIEAEFGVLCRE